MTAMGQAGPSRAFCIIFRGNDCVLRCPFCILKAGARPPPASLAARPQVLSGPWGVGWGGLGSRWDAPQGNAPVAKAPGGVGWDPGAPRPRKGPAPQSHHPTG